MNAYLFDNSEPAAALPPTERQISYAHSLARRTKVPLPEHYAGDRQLVSRYITQCLEDLGTPPEIVPPTPKQRRLARKLCRRNGMKLPAGVDRSRASMSRFLDRMMG
jgi:hypothetical protein